MALLDLAGSGADEDEFATEDDEERPRGMFAADAEDMAESQLNNGIRLIQLAGRRITHNKILNNTVSPWRRKVTTHGVVGTQTLRFALHKYHFYQQASILLLYP